jgi:Na+/H+-translocating membrane pyrophosphatase
MAFFSSCTPDASFVVRSAASSVVEAGRIETMVGVGHFVGRLAPWVVSTWGLFGDPSKDTAGSSLNVLVKLICVVALIQAIPMAIGETPNAMIFNY